MDANPVLAPHDRATLECDAEETLEGEAAQYGESEEGGEHSDLAAGEPVAIPSRLTGARERRASELGEVTARADTAPLYPGGSGLFAAVNTVQ